MSHALFQNHFVAICSWWGGKITKATFQALAVRNGAMSWWMSKTFDDPRTFLILDNIVYNPVTRWNWETFLVWSDFLCQGIWPVYQYLGKFLKCLFFLLFVLPQPPYLWQISSFEPQFPHRLSINPAQCFPFPFIGHITCPLHLQKCVYALPTADG